MGYTRNICVARPNGTLVCRPRVVRSLHGFGDDATVTPLAQGLNAITGKPSGDVADLQRELNRFTQPIMTSGSMSGTVIFPIPLAVTGVLTDETALRALSILIGQRTTFPNAQSMAQSAPDARIGWVSANLSQIIGVVRGFADVNGLSRVASTIPWKVVFGAAAVGGLLLFGRRPKRGRR